VKDHIFIRLLLNQSRWKSLILLCILLAASAELLVAFQDFDHSKIMVEGLPGPIEVTHIYFDFSGSEAIPLRENYSTPIPKPEWIKDSRSGACLFVQNSTIEISARFESPSDTDSAFIWAEAPAPPGDVEGQWVHFTNGVSDPDYYTFSTVSPAPVGLGYYTWDWQWKMYLAADGITRTLNVSGPHELYTILAVPGLPWVLNSGNTRNPWTRALDLVLTEIEAETVEEALDEVTRYCFDRPCFEYDIWSGAPCYISGYWNFNLSLFLQDMENQHDPRIGCCYDGAAIVHTLADLVGAQTPFRVVQPIRLSELHRSHRPR